MTPTLIHNLNDRAAIALGYQQSVAAPAQWFPPSEKTAIIRPDFYNNLKWCGQMLVWLQKYAANNFIELTTTPCGWEVNLKLGEARITVQDTTVSAVLTQSVVAVGSRVVRVNNTKGST